MSEIETLAKGLHCPNLEDHTPCPEGYIQWQSWAENMAKTHKQRKCAGCGKYSIWEQRK